MNYREVILKYAPKNWCAYDDEQTVLPPLSQEYKEIVKEVRRALNNGNKSVSRVIRIQNIHDLGQCLVREQQLVCANPSSSYYRVRRYIKIKQQYLTNALKYNLDHRRCGLGQLYFSKQIADSFCYDDILVVVQVITSNTNESFIRPANSLVYFIEYIIHF